MAPSRFGARARLETAQGPIGIYRLDALARAGVAKALDRLPCTIKVLLEGALRKIDGVAVHERDVAAIAAWQPKPAEGARPEIPFLPARVLLQDFTGVPVVVDLAAMRAAAVRVGVPAERVNPIVPVDLVIDHSVQVDYYGSADALTRNVGREYERNRERYQFLRWGANALQSFRAVPPSMGIVHQVNLEYLASAVARTHDEEGPVAAPDSCVGTDSHTTMIGGLGVLGWGVGGIEAEAVMLGQPYFMLLPDVVGVRLHGRLPEGATATDLTLTLTQKLRAHGVVDKLVEFCGQGLGALTLEDRATIANMAPEYGATCGFFPIDDETLSYLRRTGRSPDQVALVERYCKEQGLFRTATTPEPTFSAVLELDLGTIEPSLAGPKRPHDRLALAQVGKGLAGALGKGIREGGFGVEEVRVGAHASVTVGGRQSELSHGAVVIAAITSCTNTSNPSVMVAAGLVAKKALARGLSVPVHVKTSLAPGSRVVTDYLRRAGLLDALARLGFEIVGYGCTTCIGNSGPLPAPVEAAITGENLVAAAVLSGNRNFEGRIHPLVRANYLASPPLVVAYALAGNALVDLTTDAIGTAADGKPVYLREIWPTSEEVTEAVRESITPAMFQATYASLFEGDEAWQKTDDGATGGATYRWEPTSTYIREPPYFEGFLLQPPPPAPISDARVLCLFGDSITTDHISPAGDIAKGGPAAEYLEAHGVKKPDFNSYGSRRGNHEVMVRGTFGNIRIKNLLVPGVEGGVTVHFPSGERMTIYAAAERYRTQHIPLGVLAGKEYGSGSSRDWAAKGPALLGVRFVIAESYERIHRSNLVGMGVLPLQFLPGESAGSLGLSGCERLTIDASSLAPRQRVRVCVTSDGGAERTFETLCRLDSPYELSTYTGGGILPTVLRQLAKRGGAR
jgi:aconitate hydratase